MRRLGLACVLAVACSDDGVPAADSGSTGEADVTSGGTTLTTTSAEVTTVDSSVSGVDSSGGTDDGALEESSTGAPPMGTAGCGMAATAGATPLVIDVNGTMREYTLIVPEGYNASTPYPLVFAWHGLGSNGDQARLYLQIEQASAGAAIMIYPDGLPLESMGGQTGWDLAPEGVDVQFFDAMLAATTSTLCIDEARVFSAGHSFGGYMSNALGCFRASVLRAIGPVAGGPPFGECEADERVAAIMIHGSLDMVVPIEQGIAARDNVLARNGCAETTMPHDPEPCAAYDGCMPGYDVWWCEHDIADFSGHTWPPFAGSGIWDFFAALPPE